jgi:hypothetical protein
VGVAALCHPRGQSWEYMHVYNVSLHANLKIYPHLCLYYFSIYLSYVVNMWVQIGNLWFQSKPCLHLCCSFPVWLSFSTHLKYRTSHSHYHQFSYVYYYEFTVFLGNIYSLKREETWGKYKEDNKRHLELHNSC